MTPIERISQIMIEERQRTMADIALIDAPDNTKREIVDAVVALQDAVNKHLAAQKSAFDARIIPAALAGLTTEMGRVYKRMAEEGLTPGSPHQN
jgi:hypothetical protein